MSTSMRNRDILSAPRMPLLIAMAALLLSGGTAARAAEAGKSRFPNILFITIDTLRADKLSSYGYHLKTSPNIDQLAAEGVRFADAYTVVPRTGPSHASMFTSRYPQEHGAKLNGFSVPQDTKWLFLPQILRKFGYRNGAFVSAWVLTGHITKFDRFFDTWDEQLNRTYQFVNSMRHAEDVTPKAIDWLKQNTHQPFFLWVHYFDPHSPYDFRPEFSNFEQIGEPDPIVNTWDAGMRDRMAKYDSEVGYTDHHVGKLLKTVDDLGLRENALVVLLSDHGESLGEHDFVGHGEGLYQNILHIPLVMRLPGVIPAGKVVKGKVSTLDLAPTIVELAIKRNTAEPVLNTFRGESFAASWEGGAWKAREVVRYITWAGQKWVMPKWIAKLWLPSLNSPLRYGYTEGDEKVVWTPGKDEVSVVDIEQDPHELRPDIIEEGEARYKTETAALKRWLEITEGEKGENRMNQRDREVLKSLGYLQ